MSKRVKSLQDIDSLFGEKTDTFSHHFKNDSIINQHKVQMAKRKVVRVNMPVKNADIVTVPVSKRQSFLRAMSFYCSEQEFTDVGNAMLLDDGLYVRYIAFTEADTDVTMDQWFKEAIGYFLLKKEQAADAVVSDVLTIEDNLNSIMEATKANMINHLKENKMNNENNTIDATEAAAFAAEQADEIEKLKAMLIERDNVAIKAELAAQAKEALLIQALATSPCRLSC